MGSVPEVLRDGVTGFADLDVGVLARRAREIGLISREGCRRWVEERFGSIGPLGRIFPEACYPASLRPTDNESRYPISDEPAEQSFDLRSAPGFEEVTPHLLPDLPYEDVIPRNFPRDGSLPPPSGPQSPSQPMPREPMGWLPAGDSPVIPATATRPALNYV
jgi:hypothetical protein